ncbi:MAG: metallophosphoesterase [Porphyromonadaceae bacterium]|nr:metallophosphoesterase [Porphyromonadaceae bacterium]
MRGFFTSYENANQRFTQSQSWNAIHGFSEIAVARDNYSIFSIADSHIGSSKNFGKFIQEAMDMNALAVILNGDITNGNEKDYEKLTDILSPIESLNYFMIAGNHDLYFNGWVHFRARFGTAAYYFTVKTPRFFDLFICLDTGGGTLGDLQLRWFKNLLESMRNDYRYCVVFTHNNILRHRATMSTNLMLEEIRVFVDLLVRHKINYVVTGHDHIRNVDVLGNTTFLVMDAAFDDFKRASYLKMDFGGEKLKYEFIPFP